MDKRVSFLMFFLLSAILCGAQTTASWKFKTGGRVYSSPAVESNRIFIGSEDHYLYSLDNKGNLIWKFKTNGAVHSSPVVDGQYVFAASADGNLYAVNKLTGKEQWHFRSRGEKMYDMWDYYLSSPKVHKGLVYWGSGDGFIYAIQAQSGKLAWSFETGDVVHAEPLIHNNKVYIGSFNGYFYCLDAASGQLLWKFKTVGDTHFPKGEIQKGAIAKDGIIYFGSRDYNIYAVDAETGRGRWNKKERGSWVVATPLVYNNHIYFGTSDTHAFYCMEATYGEDKWRLPLNMRVYGSAVANDSLIYFGCFNGKLYGVDPQAGTIKFHFQTDGSIKNYHTVYDEQDHFRKGFEVYGKDMEGSEKQLHLLGAILGTPAISGGTIYFGSSDGYVYAVPLK